MSDEALTYLQGDSTGAKRDMIALCYYELAQGDPKSGPVRFAVLLTACAEQVARLPGELHQTNGEFKKLLAEGREIDLALGADLFQERVGHLDENAGAITGVHLATARAAVVEIQKNCQRLGDDFVGLPAFDIDHKTHAASIMLELRVIQALFGRQSVFVHFRLLLTV